MTDTTTTNATAKFIWTLENGGYTWYMRGTTWTSDRDRATEYDDLDAAFAAQRKAGQFMKARDVKRMALGVA